MRICAENASNVDTFNSILATRTSFQVSVEDASKYENIEVSDASSYTMKRKNSIQGDEIPKLMEDEFLAKLLTGNKKPTGTPI